MQRMILAALATGAVVFAAMTAWAESPEQRRRAPQRPQRQFDPMRLFDRLDADDDGVIVLDQLSERVPERLRAMLTKADEDGDGKVTREEFKAAVEVVRERRAERRKEAAARARRARRERPEAPRRPSRISPRRRPATAPRRPPWPDLNALFERMDRDGSGKLSLEEFKAGMRRLHAHMVRRYAHARRPERRDVRRPERRPERPEVRRPERRRRPRPEAREARPERRPERPDVRRPKRRPERPDVRRPKRRPERPDVRRPERRPERPDVRRPERRPERPDVRRPERRPERPDVRRPERRRRPRPEAREARPERSRRPRGERPAEVPETEPERGI